VIAGPDESVHTKPPAPDRTQTLKVWDPLVRLAHWSLAASVILAFVSHEGGNPLHDWHEILGYIALGIVGIRLAWGFFGPRYARFAQFVRAPREVLEYARRVKAATEPRHLGHNPLGGWMVVILLAAVALASGSGWLYVTDRFWGVEWVGELHDVTGHLLLPLVALHIAGVIFTSRRHRESLVAAMVNGHKRLPQGDDIA
jgi:cytochrome b